MAERARAFCFCDFPAWLCFLCCVWCFGFGAVPVHVYVVHAWGFRGGSGQNWVDARSFCDRSRFLR